MKQVSGHWRAIILDYTIKTNELTTVEFIRLFIAAGWTPPCEEQVNAALSGSMTVFSVSVQGESVAMARVVGDGAMTFLIKDVVVAPTYQGYGLGRLLVSLLEDYIQKQLKPGWAASAELMSAEGKEGFYEKCGYRKCADKGLGSGMMKMIRR